MNSNENKNTYITEMCSCFRKTIKQNKILLIAQIINYLFLVERIFVALMEERFYLPFLTLLLSVCEIIITIVLRNTKGNIIGLCMDGFLTVLLFHYSLAELNILFFVFLSVIIHIFRIQSISAVSRLKNIYGYPGFHDFFITNEGKSDEAFLNMIFKQYREVSNLKVMQYEIAKQKTRTIIKIMQTGGFVLCLIGFVLFSNAYFESRKVSNAQTVDSIEKCVDGTYINCSVEKLLCQADVGIDSNTEDSYWGQIGNDLVVFYVPDSYKKEFAMLYNYYARTNEYDGYYEGAYDIKEASSEVIKCTGKICSVSKYDDKEVNKNALKEIQIKSLKVNDKFYIEIIDMNNVRKHLTIHGSFIVVGLLIIILCEIIRLISLNRKSI